MVKLPQADVVACWQGSGTSYSFDDTSSIDVTITASDGTKKAVNANYIIGVMFDRDALGVTGYNRRTPSKYVAKAEFYNYWYKEDAGYFNDYNENFVVFLAD